MKQEGTLIKQLRHTTLSFNGDNWLKRSLLLLMLATFLIVLVFPLVTLFIKAFQNEEGVFVGVQNFVEYFSSPALVQSLQNTMFISSMTTVISVSLAFSYAYCLVRTDIKGKTFFRYMALLPLFAPTMMHGIALVYLFGNQGIVTNGFFGLLPAMDINLYGSVGIIIAEVIFTFPQAFMIMLVALGSSDYRLYEAANTLGVNKAKQFFTITLPSVKYGLISAIFIVFSLSFTDYGAPKVVGGQYNVLATDIYQQVVGQQNMSMGATVGIILMIPAIMAFVSDQMVNRKQNGSLSARSIPYQVKKNKKRNALAFTYVSLITACVLLVFGAVLLAALVNNWPYDLSLSLEHFQLESYTGGGFTAYWNSVLVAALSAVIGTAFTFVYAYGIEKIRKMTGLRKAGRLFSILPIAVPGLIIGISYILFFSQPTINIFGFSITNPFHFLYGTIAIIVIANILHFYSVAYVTATSALKKLDQEFETVSESMGVPMYKSFIKVTLPMCLPAILEMVMYFFVNSMVTISAVVFLYTAEFKLASISIVNMDEAGNLAQAAALSVLIIATNIFVRMVYELAVKLIRKRQLRLQHSNMERIEEQ
ncbi:putative 2-aminoethylphosphonate ABC transporter permease subunit [Halobacillus shinanisalinarum]|uniref:2-aminoethylphosphonate ABC transporter permease subunit n=1 Tax=Halobacillus shinanisalinarum TaxID=2932258 RepID=A0ABY4H339_9BACI|nr:putative 2-aminoethylphosphonate ABC transporter permease subunit [Halobacillus shinanisalinarum]UOQ94871.1 putative 2-aminoethylphosphonate ABC transporter permease subunit [Halobacillus shinanisalinarum]